MNPKQEFPPHVRARYELGQSVNQGVGLDALTENEGRVMRELFGIDGRDSSMTMSARKELLTSVAGKIENRKVELLIRRFVNTQLGYSGLLGLAIGDPGSKIQPVTRPVLMRKPLISKISAKNPNVDPNVILDKTLERDVRWLTEPTIPRLRTN